MSFLVDIFPYLKFTVNALLNVPFPPFFSYPSPSYSIKIQTQRLFRPYFRATISILCIFSDNCTQNIRVLFIYKSNHTVVCTIGRSNIAQMSQCLLDSILSDHQHLSIFYDSLYSKYFFKVQLVNRNNHTAVCAWSGGRSEMVLNVDLWDIWVHEP